jgi:hypothetical protein
LCETHFDFRLGNGRNAGVGEMIPGLAHSDRGEIRVPTLVRGPRFMLAGLSVLKDGEAMEATISTITLNVR